MKKRIFDIAVASALLLLLWPFLVVIFVVIKLTSKGPGLFCQERLGKDQKPFVIFKFRTMKPNSSRPTDFITRGDDRVTPIGRILRPFHFDELPQLVNVLRGEMGMVGPRPERIERFHAARAVIATCGYRFGVKPGASGLIQIHGREKMALAGHRKSYLLERYYIRRQSLWLDIRILVVTAVIMLRRQGV